VRFSTKWLDDAPNAAPEERATACDLTVWINEHNVCLHVDGSDAELYDHVTMPAYSLVEGLVHNWWNIFSARDKEYALIKHRMGYAVPDVRFRYDGAVFESFSNQHFYQNPDVRFWGCPTEVLTRQQAEDALAKFVEDVLSRLGKKAVKGTSAELRWARVRGSREDSEETAFCEAAGALGVDPYDVAHQDRAFIEQSGKIFSGEPLIEFLGGVAGHSFRQATLPWITEVEARPGYQSRLPELGPLVDRVARAAPTRAGDRSWAIGYRRARATRAALNMIASDRLRLVSEWTTILGNKSFRRASPVNGLRALISTQNESVHIHLRDRPPTQEARVSELFAFTRAVGDVICFPRTRRSVVNSLHEAHRQSAGRAFAAEFLAPIDEISSMQEDDADLATIADELNVSTEVIERQIENQARIRSVCD
jgi:hypothetical protein